MSTHPPEAWLRRIQALLAKAESTDFPEEAEALLAKAQELMTRHAIDEALLVADGRASADEVGTEKVLIPRPYASAKASLLANVASANGCRCVRTRTMQGDLQVVLVGFRGDIASSVTLFVALSMHGDRVMLSTPIPAHDTPRRFRHAFLLGYAQRIGRRLRAAAKQVHQAPDARRSDEGPSVAVVMAAREDQVDRALAEAFPFLDRAVRRSSSSWAGATAGQAAADRADLGGGRFAGPPVGLAPG